MKYTKNDLFIGLKFKAGNYYKITNIEDNKVIFISVDMYDVQTPHLKPFKYTIKNILLNINKGNWIVLNRNNNIYEIW